jgi:hypothetical protein
LSEKGKKALTSGSWYDGKEQNSFHGRKQKFFPFTFHPSPFKGYNNYMDNRIPLTVIALSDEVEECIRNTIVKDNEETRVEVCNNLMARLMDEIAGKESWCLAHGFKNIPIICRPDIRLYFRRLIERKFPRMKVISYLEITPAYKLDVISIISFNDYSTLSET